MDTISTKLNKERQALLDLSFRNTLINYRPLKSRGVTVVDELPQELYKILILRNKEMSFLPSPETAEPTTEIEHKEVGLDTEVSLPPILDLTEREIREHHLDNKLQTSHIAKDLEKRLLNTYYAANTYIQEQGVNVLYLALGMLEWYEAKNSGKKKQSPLVLIPVSLTRSSVRAPFRVRYTGDDLGDNLSLHAKLQTDFGLDLPALPESESLNLSAYFNSVEQAIATQSQWCVNRDAVALGFFTFGAFLMYNDLDAVQWPEQNAPGNHAIVKALLGDGFQQSSPENELLQLDEDTFIDDYVRPQESHQVVDADSSQILAILDVNHGHNLVIQGPPGTGKSQTITNIIAEAIGAGKKVLFVAEKMAALEVVQRRLTTVGLGDACLELHSHKSNKKAVLSELKRTWSLSKPATIDGSHDYQSLLEKQKQLNTYSDAVNTPILQSELTPYAVYGHLLHIRKELNTTNAPELHLDNPQSWSRWDFEQKREETEKLQVLIQDAGTLTEHPFWGSQYLTFLPNNRRQIEESARKAAEAIAALKNVAGQVNTNLQLSPPNSIGDSANSYYLAQHMLNAPNLDGIEATDALWHTHSAKIQEAVTAGTRINKLHAQFDANLIPEAWIQDVLPIRKIYAAYNDKWWRTFSGEFRSAKQELEGLCQATLPKDLALQMEMIEAIMEVQRLVPVLQDQEALFSQIFGSHWQGEHSDWSHLTAVTDWLIPTHENIANGNTPESIIEHTAKHPHKEQLQTISNSINQASQLYSQSIKNVLASTKIDENIRWGSQGAFQKLSFSKQEALLKQWQADPGRVQDMVTYNHLVTRLDELSISPVIGIAMTWADAPQHLSHLVSRTYYDALIEAAFAERPLLSTFNSATHEQKIKGFCELDKHQFELNRQQLIEAHWRTLPKHDAGGQLGILLREFEKKSRHKPIRKLMTEAGNAIQALKPVFMMGPMSVAIYLPPDTLQFDLVVFDEASQVRPIDAFGSILRGKQAVVVGDSKQLPPTTFFDKMIEEEESVTGDLESILGLFAAQGSPQKMLRWHYRSRHESLIAVSNYEFYDNKLVIFPSPSNDNTQRGLVYHHLKDTYYDRGKSRTNPQEAEAVARAVLDHAQNCPELTLGVAAFSTSQMQSIQDWVERLRRLDPAYEDFFRRHPEEPFFVKNLENIQGDERDVIFISIGYGRDINGQLTMNFGPLNNDGGERRLNVLITRARQRCELFTNLEAADINLQKTKAQGVIALKQYLSYAKNRQLNIPKPTEREADSPFEATVAASIRELGYDVVHQVGSASFSIDLAIKDPAHPDRYLLGIECDGATYHSARSARDRDRLRQYVLEGLGWKIHHIWSTDWFQNPTKQMERLVESIEAAQVNEPIQVKPQEIAPVKKEIKLATPPKKEKKKKEKMHFEAPKHAEVTIEKNETQSFKTLYEQAILSIPSNPPLIKLAQTQLSNYVSKIVAIESPVHKREVKRRILAGAKVPRSSSRIDIILTTAINLATVQGIIKQKGDFLWLRNMDNVSLIRNRENLPKASQKVEFVSPEEIELAIITAVTNSYGLREDELPRAALTLLGFNRVTAKRKKTINHQKEQMIKDGTLYHQGDFLLCK